MILFAWNIGKEVLLCLGSGSVKSVIFQLKMKWSVHFEENAYKYGVLIAELWISFYKAGNDDKNNVCIFMYNNRTKMDL